MLNARDHSARWIAEVIEASTTEFVAQCYDLDGAPDFGSFVRVRDRALDIFAVVSEVRTASLDPGRRPVVRGQELVPTGARRRHWSLDRWADRVDLRAAGHAVRDDDRNSPDAERCVLSHIRP